MLFWSRDRDLNPGPHPYHGCALPTELSRHIKEYTTRGVINVGLCYIIAYMNTRECDICRGPEIYGELPQLVDSDMWRVELNPNQQHLGRTFVGLREHKPDLASLTEEEFLEFRRIVALLETSVRNAFKTDLFNWMCLMNNAKRDNQETHVHWHMVPRYNNPVEFSGHIYTDDAWPGQYNTGSDQAYIPSYQDTIAIGNAIRRGIGL